MCSNGMTTKEAADFLNVSHAYLVALLDSGELELDEHRRINLQTLQTYKERMAKGSKEARDELAKQAQELGMGYCGSGRSAKL